MTTNAILQLALYLAVLLLLVKPLGSYMAGVYEGRATQDRQRCRCATCGCEEN